MTGNLTPAHSWRSRVHPMIILVWQDSDRCIDWPKISQNRCGRLWDKDANGWKPKTLIQQELASFVIAAYGTERREESPSLTMEILLLSLSNIWNTGKFNGRTPKLLRKNNPIVLSKQNHTLGTIPFTNRLGLSGRRQEPLTLKNCFTSSSPSRRMAW